MHQHTEVKEPIYAAQQMITRDVVLEVELIKELILVRRLTHHGLHLRLRRSIRKPQVNF